MRLEQEKMNEKLTHFLVSPERRIVEKCVFAFKNCVSSKPTQHLLYSKQHFGSIKKKQFFFIQSLL